MIEDMVRILGADGFGEHGRKPPRQVHREVLVSVVAQKGFRHECSG